MSFFTNILAALEGANVGDIEKNAGDLLTRLEKLGADVIGSNGNVLAALVAVGEDFATLKQVVADVRAIVDDLKGLQSAAASPAAPPPPVTVASPTPASVSALDILKAVATAVDPFAPKPLAHVAPAQVNEPHGGA